MDAEVMPAYRCDGDDLSGGETNGNLGSEICHELCETLSGDWFGEIKELDHFVFVSVEILMSQHIVVSVSLRCL
jgi:hypothetical protein